MQPGRTDPPDQTPGPRAWLDLVTCVATSVWTLRRKLAQSTGSPEMDRLRIHVDAIHDALRQAEVEIQDYPVGPYHPGMAVEIVVFQPQPEVEQELIAATVRPAVFWRGQMIQRGQIVVATPQRSKQP